MVHWIFIWVWLFKLDLAGDIAFKYWSAFIYASRLASQRLQTSWLKLKSLFLWWRSHFFIPGFDISRIIFQFEIITLHKFSGITKESWLRLSQAFRFNSSNLLLRWVYLSYEVIYSGFRINWNSYILILCPLYIYYYRSFRLQCSWIMCGFALWFLTILQQIQLIPRFRLTPVVLKRPLVVRKRIARARLRSTKLALLVRWRPCAATVYTIATLPTYQHIFLDHLARMKHDRTFIFQRRFRRLWLHFGRS